ncbi:Methyltransferase FkbM [Artemisia annua]|uniref:Methyltransferase FkbM n=1 Tax=Artemisia annua TaxID=35608 RepID=A0A2U1KK46_ARTAN|nr:Methyltransferase FkbM [Artemisia annua]
MSSSPRFPYAFIPPLSEFTAFCRQRRTVQLVYVVIFLVLTNTIYQIMENTPPDDPDTETTTEANQVYNSFEADIDQHFTNYYKNIFNTLKYDGFVTWDSKILAIGAKFHTYTVALLDAGLSNSLSTKRNVDLPFGNDTFDVVYSTHTGFDCSEKQAVFAKELERTVKPDGFLVIHTEADDLYSLNSLLDLFESFRLVRTREIEVIFWSIPEIREVVMKKQLGYRRRRDVVGNCSVPAFKMELIRKMEDLVLEEPVKRSPRKIKYLTSIVDIDFKTRYVYIDVGAKSYGSSIGSWFKKTYPKQNKKFEIFAIEGNQKFHEEYKSRKKVTLLPYEAWVRNESLFFEINRDPSPKNEEKGKGMGRVQSAQTSTTFVNAMNKIQGFDFAAWVKSSFTEKDFVVVKMDVEGAEFDLIKKMVETGAVCLVDEMFVECHYNRWKRSMKYQKRYKDCLELFSSLRDTGIFVHQWRL